MKNKHKIYDSKGNLNRVALEGAIDDLYKVVDDSEYHIPTENQQDTTVRTQSLSPPNNITASILKSTSTALVNTISVRVMWDASKEADLYRVELTIDDETDAPRVQETSDTVTVFTGLSGIFTARVRVMTVRKTIPGPWSEPVFVSSHDGSSFPQSNKPLCNFQGRRRPILRVPPPRRSFGRGPDAPLQPFRRRAVGSVRSVGFCASNRRY